MGRDLNVVRISVLIDGVLMASGLEDLNVVMMAVLKIGLPEYPAMAVLKIGLLEYPAMYLTAWRLLNFRPPQSSS